MDLKENGVRVRTGFMCLRTGSSGGILCTLSGTLEFHKRRGISWPVEWLSSYEKVVWSIWMLERNKWKEDFVSYSVIHLEIIFFLFFMKQFLHLFHMKKVDHLIPWVFPSSFLLHTSVIPAFLCILSSISPGAKICQYGLSRYSAGLRAGRAGF
jgi:hypothetical protein